MNHRGHVLLTIGIVINTFTFLHWTQWMIVPNQITVPVQIGTVVRDFRTILFGSVRGSSIWYEILVRLDSEILYVK